MCSTQNDCKQQAELRNNTGSLFFFSGKKTRSKIHAAATSINKRAEAQWNKLVCQQQTSSVITSQKHNGTYIHSECTQTHLPRWQKISRLLGCNCVACSSCFVAVLFLLWPSNRAGHYILQLWFLLSFFFSSPILSGRVTDWMYTILPHMNLHNFVTLYLRN